jgi:hypothetical protein
MEELLRTNDIVLISFISALLNDDDIEFMVVDQHMSILEGSLGAIPRRILVESSSFDQARRLVRGADLANELTEIRP